ncbi:MAG TPA: tetratricopeptide repeat protein [Bacteroidota bacterium]|nr:tetratricopeptide repeat protein [Bacteroidota bacterium]
MTTGTSPRELEQHLAAHPSSPLFARLAEALLTSGEVTRAGELCERGLSLYPDYTTGVLIHAKCLAGRGDHVTAVRTLSRVIRAYPENIVLAQLGEEWSGLAAWRDRPPAETSGSVPDTPAVTAPDAADAATEPVRAQTAEHSPGRPAGMEELSPAVLPGPTDTDVETPRSDVPDDAVMFLGGIPHPAPPMQGPPGFGGDDRIISRTLAEIYASQGAVREAVETYRLLLRRMPDREESFADRLKELEEQLGAGPDEPEPPPG